MIITPRSTVFSDPGKIKGKLKNIDAEKNKSNFYKPGHKEFFRSDKVVELQWLLAEILEDMEIRLKLVASVCAIENCSYETQKELLELEPVALAKTFITGTLEC